MLLEILMLAQGDSGTGITIGTGAVGLICGVIAKHLISARRNNGKYVRKELFDERTKNISDDIREIKVSIKDIYDLLRSKQ